MSFGMSDQTRLLVLIIGCAILWSAEAVVPLYKYENRRLRRALPNIALAGMLVITNLALSSITAAASSLSAERNTGLSFLVNMSPWLAALIGIMALDLFTYFAHVLLHQSSLGWKFHRVHHSEKEVNVTTAFRQHPGETLWRILWQVLAVVIFGIPLWVVVTYLMVSTLNAQLEHTNIKLAEPLDRALRLVFVTPNMHKVHHSRAHIETDTNYSNIFSLWDRIFSTYTPTIDFHRLRYGLKGFDDQKRHTLRALLKLPFATNR